MHTTYEDYLSKQNIIYDQPCGWGTNSSGPQNSCLRVWPTWWRCFLMTSNCAFAGAAKSSQKLCRSIDYFLIIIQNTEISWPWIACAAFGPSLFLLRFHPTPKSKCNIEPFHVVNFRLNVSLIEDHQILKYQSFDPFISWYQLIMWFLVPKRFKKSTFCHFFWIILKKIFETKGFKNGEKI